MIDAWYVSWKRDIPKLVSLMVMLQGGELFASCRVILQNGPVRFEHYGYRLLETQSERSQLAEVIL